MPTKSLYVGNLPHGTTEDELRELFAQFGPLEAVRVIEGKGFAFVDLPDDKAAEAIAAMNGRDLKGRALRVDEARPKRERDDRGAAPVVAEGAAASGGAVEAVAAPREAGDPAGSAGGSTHTTRNKRTPGSLPGVRDVVRR